MWYMHLAVNRLDMKSDYTITLWFLCLDGLIQTRGNVASEEKGAKARAEGLHDFARFS
jgi:hypothetical protein